MADSNRDQILELLRDAGVLDPRDLQPLGISGEYLNKLHAEGILNRPRRGPVVR